MVKAYFNVDESTDSIYLTDVSSCPYEFTEWFDAGENEEFPNNMSFYYMEESDPSIHSNISGILKNIQFNYQSKTRINALGSKGLSLINTSSENENYFARRLGIIALAVSTKNLNNIRLKFTAGTILANPRKYNLRLQYRIGTNGAIFDVYDANNQLVEYLGNEQSGHEQSFDILLPQELMNKDTVQLLWRYYYSGKQNDLTTNQRDELRLDNIFIINEDYKQTIDTIENNNINEKTLVAHIEGNSYQ